MSREVHDRPGAVNDLAEEKRLREKNHRLHEQERLRHERDQAVLERDQLRQMVDNAEAVTAGRLVAKEITEKRNHAGSRPGVRASAGISQVPWDNPNETRAPQAGARSTDAQAKMKKRETRSKAPHQVPWDNPNETQAWREHKASKERTEKLYHAALVLSHMQVLAPVKSLGTTPLGLELHKKVSDQWMPLPR